MSAEFDGKWIVVTGGTGALGAAVVRRALRSGARCVVSEYADAVPDGWEWTGDERVRVITSVDLSDDEGAERCYREAMEHAGSIWASIHVAGGFAMAPITETSLDDYRRQIDMNLTSCFLCCREVVRCMRRSGGGGRIVNVAAKPALHPAGGMCAYSASKAGVANLTVSLAEELASDGIWVNAVVPSIMDTPTNRSAMPDAAHDRWPGVDEVAATILFLASPENRVTRGALVPVYGRS